MIEDGHGFMGFWSDIEPAYHLTYQEWHNCEHMPERVSIPGFVEGRRYRGTGDGPAFFMCYVTESPDVLRSEAYLAALNRPTPWTQEALTRFRNPARTLYGRIASAGDAPLYRPYLALVRFDHPQDSSLLADLLRNLLRDRDDVAGSLFEVDAAASGIMTAERKIYSGGPSRQQFLIALESHDRGGLQALLESAIALLGSDAKHVESGLCWLEARVRAVEMQRPDAAAAHLAR